MNRKPKSRSSSARKKRSFKKLVRILGQLSNRQAGTLRGGWLGGLSCRCLLPVHCTFPASIRWSYFCGNDNQQYIRFPANSRSTVFAKRPGHALFLGVAGVYFSLIFFAPHDPILFFRTFEYIAARIPRGFHKGPTRVTCQRHPLIPELLQSGNLCTTLPHGMIPAIPQSLYPPEATDKHSAIELQSLITRTPM
jgi:hypothetical protein